MGHLERIKEGEGEGRRRSDRLISIAAYSRDKMQEVEDEERVRESG